MSAPNLPLALSPSFTVARPGEVLMVYFCGEVARTAYDLLRSGGAPVSSLEVPRYGNASFVVTR
jgi:hypothetical protein